MSLNVAAFTGRFASDPELRHTQSDTAVCSFSIAVDRNYCKQGEDRQTDWIDCVAWRGLAEFICKYFHKGSMIAVNGEMNTRTYTDRDGNKRKAVELVVANANFCGSKKDNQGSIDVQRDEPPEQTAAGGSDFVEIAGDDDLPFD